MPFELKEHKLTDAQKKQLLESSTFYFIQRNEFSGSLLQEFNMGYTTRIPTAACCYNPRQEQFEISLNPDFFASCAPDERVAVLAHEVLHFAHQHLFRLPFATAKPEERMLFNIAGDMAINQLIENLPDVPGIVRVEDYKLADGSPFPKFKTMEEYYQLIQQNKDQPQNKKNLGQYQNEGGFDVHDWDQLPEDEKRRMLEQAKKMVERTIEKTSMGRSAMPDAFKDLLEDLKVQINKLDYKAVLKNAIKKTISCFERDRTWFKPNKRYGSYAPGTTNGKLPKLGIYIDTSGSISHEEANSFLQVADNFLKVGSKTCHLALWHTDVYTYKKYKNNVRLSREEIESGGTDIHPVFEHINKHRPDLAIILTDGYYGESSIKPCAEIVWLISHGNLNHFYKTIGKTIGLEGIING